MSQRYTVHVALCHCDTHIVPLAPIRVPNTALNLAKIDTELAIYGTKRARTGTAFSGYIVS